MWYLYLSEPPLSHLDTDCRETPSCSASSSWDHPFCFLNINIFSDKVISPSSFLICSASIGSKIFRCHSVFLYQKYSRFSYRILSIRVDIFYATNGCGSRSHLVIHRFSGRYLSDSISRSKVLCGLCRRLFHGRPDDGRNHCLPPAGQSSTAPSPPFSAP